MRAKNRTFLNAGNSIGVRAATDWAGCRDCKRIETFDANAMSHQGVTRWLTIEHRRCGGEGYKR